MKVYLAGAMYGQSEDQIMGWRKEASIELSKIGCQAIYPPGMGSDRSDQEIVTLDKAAVSKCEMLLCYGGIPSWGTAMEVFLAASLGKPVITFMNLDDIRSSGWLSDLANAPVWLRYHSTKV